MGIVAILTAIAVPAYTNHVIRGKIPEALGILAVKRANMEQYQLDHSGSYVNASDCSSDTTSSKYFTFSCSVVPTGASNIYTLQAVGVGSMAGFTYTLDQSNTQTTTITAPPAWVTPTTSCWITKQGGVC